MKPEEFIASEEIVALESHLPEGAWQIDSEPTNIISLAERGLLVFPRYQAPIDDFAYDSYSPLNEW